MRKTIIFFIFWLLAVNVFALLVLNRFNLEGDTAYSWIDPSKLVQDKSWNIIDLHAKWDSFWYLDIARNGYIYNGSDKLSNIVFFPLYPMLIKGVSLFFGNNLILAGWLLSIVFLLGAILYIYKIVKEFHPGIDPESPIFYLLIFPTAFFLNAVYTEALFLFLSAAVFYYAFKRQFVLAGALGFLAGLTRVTGILLFIPLVWEYYRHHSFRGLFDKKFLPLLLVPLGTFLFFIYHQISFGDFLLFFKVESSWGRSFQFNKGHFSLISHPAVINFVLDILFAGFAFVISYLALKRSWVSYGLYMLATIFVALSTGTFMSIGRYILVLFPMYISLASIKNEHFRDIYALGSILLLAMNITLFVNNYWAG